MIVAVALALADLQAPMKFRNLYKLSVTKHVFLIFCLNESNLFENYTRVLNNLFYFLFSLEKVYVVRVPKCNVKSNSWQFIGCFVV